MAAAAPESQRASGSSSASSVHVTHRTVVLGDAAVRTEYGNEGRFRHAAPAQWRRVRETSEPHRKHTKRVTPQPHHAPAHVWGWNPSAIMVAHMHFSVNTTIDIRETHFGGL